MTSQGNSKTKILVVDDEPDNLDLLYRTFHEEYQVLRAESGPAALDILATAGDIAVIISDQRMPLMSGTEFLSLTATQYPDVIRIILTGYTDVEDLVEAINSGKVFKYVTKPWDAVQLLALVRQAVDTHNVLKARTKELCRTLRQESLLNAVTNTIRSRTNYRQILQTIVETVGQMFEVSCCILRPVHDDQLANECFIYQKDENGKKREEKGNSHSSSTLPTSSLFQTVWDTRDVEVMNDVLADERFSETEEGRERAAIYQAANIRSSLVVPLFCRLDFMAVLALHEFGTPRVWQDDEVQMVIMVADQAAFALAQARAYEQVRALAKREALINTITTAIRSSLNPQDIFAAITQQLGQALHADGCALSLWTEEDEYVQCVGLYDSLQDTYHKEPLESSHQPASPSYSPGTLSRPAGNAKAGENKALGASRNAREAQNTPAPSSLLPRSVVPIRGNPVLLQLLMTQQPVVVSDLESKPELNVFDMPLRSPARALLVVPLISDGQIIGSISLRQTHAPRQWEASEIELAQAVAAQAAIAVQQARLYQKTRQQAERLLELDRLKTEFFQNISHEFRTPLTLMLGPLESVVAQHGDLPYAQAEIALRNSRRLLRLVNQLLDLQRIDAGRMQPTFRPCDLVDFVNQTVDSFRPYCDKKGVGVYTHLSECSSVYLDLEKFDKVLYNLLSNAMKFTPKGGSIIVTLQRAGDHCLLQVKDTGVGIRSDQIPHLFERFRQAEGSASRSYEGSGLGLALVKELVELHGGQIAVESVYRQGATFTIWLPIGTAHLPPEQIIEVPTGVLPSRAAVELADVEFEQETHDLLELSEELKEATRKTSASPTQPSVPAQGGLPKAQQSVLFVDDNPDLRTYVSGILKQQGYHVIVARNGAEGFSLSKEQHPDLIVTDLMMPLVSGLDMIRMIREEEGLKGIPIILLTAKVNEDTRIEGVEGGADGYLAKPFNDRELLASVRNLLALKENERRIQELNTYLTESVLRRFLPPSMVIKAAAGELLLDLRPEPRLITILFSDIVGFTQLANTLRSRRVAEVLNEYLAEMTRAVFDSGGTVDKFVGDAVMALFGAPEELTPNEQVRRAVAAARQMQHHLAILNRRWQEQGLVGAQGVAPIQFRCGIHQGTAVVGMFGGADRADYTAIGPSVNISARLQEAADPGSILVSAAVADYLDEEEITKFRPLKLKGIDETVLTFVVNSHE
ncbi:response regulator [Microcoleus sp. FACHB-68]|uniref:response regulator n=1 Tax=Microcoleus sp. FACHB-68 TaxID=2692826 RepID=UPI00168419E1|nr:response regulator [Microcoleus sp. FACHB-68]MBD1940573.1 response regulator [Microcoleus sp. FACHB-68]